MNSRARAHKWQFLKADKKKFEIWQKALAEVALKLEDIIGFLSLFAFL